MAVSYQSVNATTNDSESRSHHVHPQDSAASRLLYTATFEPLFQRTNSIVCAIFASYGWRFAVIGTMQVLSALESESFNTKAVLVSIASLFLVNVAQALITAHSTFQNQLVTVQITSALQHLLFRKSLVLDAKCRREKAAGDIANMFSTDIQTIINFSIFANQLWLIQVTITLYTCCTT
ncbi:hypothetical protein H310_07506 [Aphanomyces invadans]|uniref:ABC transmembrane type-1 domain-containing protein n=1 Tax=Aphanomyces invadans TaxID=157072 RepID=A0A024U1E7_9STRA|nr:hypothetical protein H310_07506 [Aphanomyces invadans]ETW00079.1 hypothetical protein H310_07506 [Aphanomyces invadans]|eukprot:XP_008871104.1 hypothetical protein H310_07506 [Aphanomyces invadans]